MKYDSRFVQIVLWETLENAPMLMGFLLAAYTQAKNLAIALCILLVSTALSAALIHFTEHKKYSNRPSIKETIVNFITFTLLSIPFVFYISTSNVWWSNWITDIVLGTIAGFALSFGESQGWSSLATTKTHSISMAISIVLFLSGIRLTYSLGPVMNIFVVGILFNIVVSTVIVLVDYWPIKKSNQGIDGSSKPASKNKHLNPENT